MVVGDIHGCLTELKALMALAAFRSDPTCNACRSRGIRAGRIDEPDADDVGSSPCACDVLVHVGDLVNKGPNSFEVVRHCIENRALGVVGNHDRKLIKLVKRIRKKGKLKKHDAQSTLAALAYACPDDVFEYLSALPYILRLPTCNVLVVHAGIVPDVPLDQQDPWTVTEMRNLIERAGCETRPSGCEATLESSEADDKDSSSGDGADLGLGSRWRATKDPKDGGVAWASLWMGPEVVVFGHDARRRFQRHPFAIGLDTGCAYGGQLTAAVFSAPCDGQQGTHEILSIDAFTSNI